MIGIYKITNQLNGHCYIGQSRDIITRWKNHKIASHNENDKGYNYPLYQAIRKYGIDNFSFEIIEECDVNELNNKEHYWIKYYNPEYNQTEGGDYQIHGIKLTHNQVKEIQQLLLNSDLSTTEIGKKYNVHEDTIRSINHGRSWIDSSLTYPLRPYIKKEKQVYYCKNCGKIISKYAEYCIDCRHDIQRKQSLINMPITREKLKYLIRTESFLSIGKKFNVTDNTIRKWCDKYNLPRKKKDIKSYSNEEWDKI